MKTQRSEMLFWCHYCTQVHENRDHLCKEKLAAIAAEQLVTDEAGTIRERSYKVRLELDTVIQEAVQRDQALRRLELAIKMLRARASES